MFFSLEEQIPRREFLQHVVVGVENRLDLGAVAGLDEDVFNHMPTEVDASKRWSLKSFHVQ